MKKNLFLVIIFVLVVSCASPIGKGARDSVKRIGIISAMSNEIQLLLGNAQIERTDRIGGLDFNVGKLNGKDVVIVQAGIGKVLASAGAAALLNNYNIDNVIFTGIAGGVGDETKVLDIVVGSELFQHDYGMVTNNGFVWQMIGSDESKAFYQSDPKLMEIAYDSAKEVMGGKGVFKGRIATGDQFIASEEYVRELQSKFNAIACEMEGAAVALVCKQYDVPFVVIRAMSDKADGQAHESIANMGDIAADNSSRIVMKMLEKI